MKNKKNIHQSDPDILRIKGAREHNLKNINIDIPKGKIVVITSVSGSENLHWLLTPYMLKVKEDMLKVYQPTWTIFGHDAKTRCGLIGDCLQLYQLSKKPLIKTPDLLLEQLLKYMIT